MVSGTPVRAACRVTGRDGPKVHMEAELIDAAGVICLAATGTYRILPPGRFEVRQRRTNAAGDVTYADLGRPCVAGVDDPA